MRSLERRLHSGAELRRKLVRKEYGETMVDAVLEDLVRLGYVNDEQFARTRALSAAQHKHHGRRRGAVELMKAGVKGEVAEGAGGRLRWARQHRRRAEPVQKNRRCG